MSSTYPTPDIELAAHTGNRSLRPAVISWIEEDSPAYDAGFESGCALKKVNGHVIRDIIDWRWYSAEDEIELEYIDLDGDEGTIVLEREPDEDWGFQFETALFDQIKICKNNCIFCFMQQLPTGMRSSLSLRDDDFRLSFLSGTFVTFTNLSSEDEQRIIEQHISPLRVSLHAVSPDVREKMIRGKHSAHGIAVLERLLDAGIEFHAQIVLVPGVNDGEELKRTLEWAYAHPGIVEIGIVPLGFTKYQDRFTKSFNDSNAACDVLKLVGAYQTKAQAERGETWAYAADEFYRNAYGTQLLEKLPPAQFYGDFSMFEDGVGIIRSFIDDWQEACASGEADELAELLESEHCKAFFIVGEAMQPFFDQLIEQSPLSQCFQALTIENTYFGGNVDVTGLLTGFDLIRAINEAKESGLFDESSLLCIPEVVLNDDDLLLDSMSLDQVSEAVEMPIYAVSCSASGFLGEIMSIVEDKA